MILRLKRFSTRKWTHIIIHHSASEDAQTYDWEAIDRYHKIDKGWEEIGYHLGVEYVNGQEQICIGRSLSKQGGHTIGMNEVAIGICVVGNFDVQSVTDEKYNVVAGLCNVLMQEFNIPIDNIQFHREYANKSCPGELFSKDKLLEACLVKNNHFADISFI